MGDEAKVAYAPGLAHPAILDEVFTGGQLVARVATLYGTKPCRPGDLIVAVDGGYVVELPDGTRLE